MCRMSAPCFKIGWNVRKIKKKSWKITKNFQMNFFFILWPVVMGGDPFFPKVHVLGYTVAQTVWSHTPCILVSIQLKLAPRVSTSDIVELPICRCGAPSVFISHTFRSWWNCLSTGFRIITIAKRKLKLRQLEIFFIFFVKCFNFSKVENLKDHNSQ